MGRDPLHTRRYEHGYPGPGWPEGLHRCEWAIVIGDRVRRLRRDRDLTLVQMAARIAKPGYYHSYSAGYLSRLERGSSRPQLYAYLAIADVLEVSPGRLLGPDAVERDLSGGEVTLVKVVRRLGIPVEEAIARVVREGFSSDGAIAPAAQEDHSVEAPHGDGVSRASAPAPAGP